jgi:hypothetical protein
MWGVRVSGFIYDDWIASYCQMPWTTEIKVGGGGAAGRAAAAWQPFAVC